MSAEIIDGKAIAEKIRQEIKHEVESLKSRHGIVPGLAVILVGEDPASEVYVKNKRHQLRKSRDQVPGIPQARGLPRGGPDETH